MIYKPLTIMSKAFLILNFNITVISDIKKYHIIKYIKLHH